jgi:very-short-patch-repair endonuclease
MRDPCDVEVARLAARQHTMVSVPQLLDAGLTPAGVKWRSKSGRLHPVERGVYSTVPAEHRPPLAAEQAALLAVGPGAVLSHRTAAAMWGLTKRDPTTVDVIVPKQRRNRAGIRVHRAADLQPGDVRTKERLTLTSPYRSILDLAPLLNARQVAYAVSQALSHHLITDQQASTLTDTPTITRSEAERRFLAIVKKAGLPTPQTNVIVQGFEVDFYWPEHRLAVEIDGFEFHGHRQAFEDDRRKSLALEGAGVRTIRLSWRQLVDEPELVVASLARLL